MAHDLYPAVEPEWCPSHPGEIIREDIIPELRITKTDLATRLGVSRMSIYDLIDEKRSVTPEMALRLEAVIGGTARYWLQLQNNHDLWNARHKVDVSKLEAVPAKTSEQLGVSRAAKYFSEAQEHVKAGFPISGKKVMRAGTIRMRRDAVTGEIIDKPRQAARKAVHKGKR